MSGTDLVEATFDDQELFNDAESDEPASSPEPEPPQPEPQPEPEHAPEPTADLADEKPPIPPKPEWRLREDAERARAAEADLANERAEKAALKQRLEALERANQPAPTPAEKAARPDPLLDPEGYAKAVRDELREEIIAERREESLQRAAEAHPEEFKAAYTAAQQAVDPALRARMQSSRDPGKTLLEWHREQKTRQEIGGDLNAYKQRLRNEALKDPEFRKAAMAAWQAEAQPTSNGRPNVQLPPSLNGATRSGGLPTQSDPTDLSDENLWAHANS